jgi:hypothetical protein
VSPFWPFWFHVKSHDPDGHFVVEVETQVTAWLDDLTHAFTSPVLLLAVRAMAPPPAAAPTARTATTAAMRPTPGFRRRKTRVGWSV